MEYRPPASGTRRSVATRGSGAAFRARASMEGRKRFVTTPVRREQRLQLERCRAAPRCALNRCADTLQLALVLVGEGRAIAPWRREPSRRCCLASAREARAGQAVADPGSLTARRFGAARDPYPLEQEAGVGLRDGSTVRTVRSGARTRRRYEPSWTAYCPSRSASGSSTPPPLTEDQ